MLREIKYLMNLQKKKKKAKHEDEDVNMFNCSQEQMNNTYIVTCLFRKQEQGRKHREERK